MSTLGLSDVHKLVDESLDLEEVGVGLLANLALELLPIHASQAVCFFLLHFSGQPIL